MAKLSILAGSTSVSVNLFILNSTSTTGAGLTGLVYNTSGLTAYYSFAGANATSTSISLVTLASVTSSFSSGGFKEIDSTHMPGVYRFDLPNAVLAASKGRSVLVYLQGAANMVPCVLEIELTATNNQDGVRNGMSALPNTACTTNGSLLTSGSGTDQILVSGGLTTDVNSSNTWSYVQSIEGTVGLFDFSYDYYNGIYYVSAINGNFIGESEGGNTGTTFVLDSGDPNYYNDNFYNGQQVKLVSGTGAGQKATIVTQIGGVLTVLPPGGSWVNTPDGGTTYWIEGPAQNLDVNGVPDASLAASQPNAVTFAQGVVINQSQTNLPGLSITSNGGGSGIYVQGGTAGYAVQLAAGASGGSAFRMDAQNGAGIDIVTSGNGMQVYTSAGNGIDIYATAAGGSLTGHAVYLLASQTDAVVVYAGSTYAGLHIWGGQESGNAIQLSTNGSGSTTVPADLRTIVGEAVVSTGSFSFDAQTTEQSTVATNLNATVASRMATYTQPTGFLAATFPSGTIANTTNITAGIITTVTNLTNAPTAGDFTATMKASLNAATPSLGATAPAGWINTAAFAAGATIPRVTLADTLTTYTGNTPQTGDAYAYLGTNLGSLGAAATALAPSSSALSTATWTNGLASGIATTNAAAVSGTYGFAALLAAIESISTGGVTGTAQGGTASTITLAADDSGVTNGYDGLSILLSGGTGKGQWATITAYNATTKVATVSTQYANDQWLTVPDDTTTYSIPGFAVGSGGIFYPIAGSVGGPYIIKSDINVFQSSAMVFQFTPFVDQNNNPINLSGKTVALNVWMSDDNGVVKTPLFTYDNAGNGGLVVSGSDNNIVTVTFNAADTANIPQQPAFCNLWNFTNALPLSAGKYTVTPALKAV